MSFEIDLSRKTALVTGGGHGGRRDHQRDAGLGRRQGARQRLLPRPSRIGGREAPGGRDPGGTPTPSDVTDFDAAHQAVEDKPVDITVNNAGTAGTSNFTLNMFHESPGKQHKPVSGLAGEAQQKLGLDREMSGTAESPSSYAATRRDPGRSDSLPNRRASNGATRRPSRHHQRARLRGSGTSGGPATRPLRPSFKALMFGQPP